MQDAARRVAVAGLALVVGGLVACGGSPASPAPQPTPPDGAEVLLRLDTEQALPPQAGFGDPSAIVITLDGRALAWGAVPAIFPGPAVMPMLQRQVTPAGWARIVELARGSGLLVGQGVIGEIAPGSTIVRLSIVADGKLHQVSAANTFPGCLSDPCQGPPGSAEALSGFLSRLSELETFLGDDLGAEQPYVPEGYAVLVVAVPENDGLPQQAIEWPFPEGFAGFGLPLADGSGFRCGTVTGTDATAFAGILAHASQITPWRDPVDGSLHGLTVRPLLPGDGDPCRGMV